MHNIVIQEWTDEKGCIHRIEIPLMTFLAERGFPENHIVIDFDIPDEDGNKCYEKNYEEACKWPQTYAELSKSGEGIHLHYIYRGDPTKLSRIYDDQMDEVEECE